ncbi:MAG: glucose-1-phosphate adenylyltransferase [Chloroflexi bacterium]|nr:glucose-1-phosphate adenylyltransferase [Chloroflexota bacterium]
MRVVAMILAGGAGTRLTVLSEQRAKPAVPFAGRYRIIDFTLSNTVNSGIYTVGILTQYLPRSLIEHIGIGRPWDLDRSRGGVHILQPYQGRERQFWYRGTADAIYQNLNFIRDQRADTVLILSGDHIYKMDYRPMLQLHKEHNADLTIAVMRVPLEETHRFGILTVDEEGRVLEFTEKPQTPDKGNLANMGIYVFKAQVLEERLNELAETFPDLDFGKHVIPHMVERQDRVYTYPFDGYWVDVGTIASYWQTSMELLEPDSPLDLYNRDWVIHTRSYERPAAKIGPQARVIRSMICNGAVIRGTVERSILSPGVYVSPGAVVRESVVMNNTWIGPGAVLDRVIVDKWVVIGPGAQVGWGEDWDVPNKQQPDKLNTGITVVGKGAHIPPNIRVGRNVLIASGVDEEAFEPFGDTVPSGETVEGVR